MSDIIVENVTKIFDGKKVLDNFSVSFPLGSITCIKGASGSGKTTLLKIMAGLIEKDCGTVSGMPQKIAFMFQEDRLCEDFDAVSNVRLVTGRKKNKEEIIKHLCELGLEGDLKKSVKEFSGGMKRRVSLVRTVCYDADILLLDEPFKGLDASLLRIAAEYVINHAKGKTVICVTHSDAEAEMLGAGVIDITVNHQ